MSCSNCDGQPLIVARDLAEALSNALGPRRRDSNRVSQYGGKGIIKYNPSVNETNSGIKQSITLLDWQSFDGKPHQVTVEFGHIASGGGGSFPSGTGPLAYRANAQVLIGLPATMEDSFLVDIGRGQRFTASASYLALTAQMNAPPSGYSSGSMAVYAALGEGTSPTLAPVAMTMYVDDLLITTGSNSANIIVPSRANFLLPVRSSDNTNLFQLDFLDNSGATIDSLLVASGTMITPAPLSHDVYSVTITNMGLITAHYRLVFQLSV